MSTGQILPLLVVGYFTGVFVVSYLSARFHLRPNVADATFDGVMWPLMLSIYSIVVVAWLISRPARMGWNHAGSPPEEFSDSLD